MKTLLHILIVVAIVLLGVRTAGGSPFVPLKMNQAVRPVFPVRLKDSGITQGEARLIVEIGPDGAVRDSLVVGYSRREFAAEAEHAVRHWTFEPSRLGGRPIASRVELIFEFRIEGMLVREVWFDQRAPDDPRALAQLAFAARGLKELDRIPRPVSTAAPFVIVDDQGRRVAGRVLVKFYIDETGAPRMPQVVSEDNAALGWAAVNAVEQWKFEPPLRDGRPTLAIAHQSFVWPGEDK